MGRVRSTWFARLIASVLALSMLPTMAAFDGPASGLTLQGSYAQWVRAQLRTPVDAAIEAALEQAAGSGARTFEAFVGAFLDAYEHVRPGESAARAFTERDLSNEALISYLQRRFTEIATEGVLPRLLQSIASTPVNHSASSVATAIALRAAAALPLCRSIAASGPPEHVTPIRILTSARSQGP